MDIKELIFTSLKQKFVGADEATLLRIAEKKANGITDETKVQSIVEGVTFQDVLQSYGDFRVNGAMETAKKNAIADYEKQHNLKDGKVITQPKPNPKPNDLPKEDVPQWAQTLMETNKALSDKLNAFEQQQNAKTRQEQILAKAKEYKINDAIIPLLNVPEDVDLDTYFKDTAQILINLGGGSNPPIPSGGGVKEENETIAKWIEEGTKEELETKK